MRLLLISVIAIISSYSASSQTYHPLLDSTANVWHYTANWIPVKTMQPAGGPCSYQNSSQYFRLESVGDTIINGTDYRIIDNFEIWTNFVPCRFGYIREDTTTRKVYFIPNDFSPEILMYDFSLNQGDQIQLDFTPFSGVHPAGLYFVDTIFPINTAAGARNLFELRSVLYPFTDPIQWIESVGSPSGLAYLKTSSAFGGLFLNTGCNDGVFRGDNHLLVCQEQAGIRTYFDSCAHTMAFNNFCFFYGDSCYFYNICGSLNEIGILSNVQVSPNPFSDAFQMQFESITDADVSISISDLSGRLLLKPTIYPVRAGANNVPIRIDGGVGGVLVLRLESESGELLHTMIVRSTP
ncbi:MAG: hypothetical protein ACKOYC_06515 [Bacteroidota bacterium]